MFITILLLFDNMFIIHHIHTYVLCILKTGSLSNNFWKLFSDCADFVFADISFHTGTALLLKVYFLIEVLLYLTNSLCLAPLVISDFVIIKKSCQSILTNPFIHL